MNDKVYLITDVIRGRVESAVYRDPKVTYYQGYPLIEALPEIFSVKDAYKFLLYYPQYDQNHRNLPNHLRLHYIYNANQFFRPNYVHIDLEQRISRAIRAGYLTRNPADPDYWQNIDQIIKESEEPENGLIPEEMIVEREEIEPLFLTTPEQTELQTSEEQLKKRNRLRPQATGFYIAGMSGIGKSTAIEEILKLYPQVIKHSRYANQRFSFFQLVWLKLDCPFDGSVKGLCINFFQAIDDILGTNYFEYYAKSGGASVNMMLPKMKRLAFIHGIGILVIDEIQHLSVAKSLGIDRMLNFFVELVNKIGMPVILIGTYKAMPLLTGEFRQARRASGQGDLIWERMQQDKVWDQFIKALWRYQYVKTPTPLTPSLSSKLYEVSQGITDFAVKAYLLTQFRAIATGVEEINEKLITSVAFDSFRFSNDVLAALKDNDWKKLALVEDVKLIDLKAHYERARLELNQSYNPDEDETVVSQNLVSTKTPPYPSEEATPAAVPTPEPNVAKKKSSRSKKDKLQKEDLRYLFETSKKDKIPIQDLLRQGNYLQSAAELFS